MKVIIIAIIAVMVAFNLWCFYKSRKFLNQVNEDGNESDENYQKGLKYIKISVFVSVLICFIGSIGVILVKVL